MRNIKGCIKTPDGDLIVYEVTGFIRDSGRGWLLAKGHLEIKPDSTYLLELDDGWTERIRIEGVQHTLTVKTPRTEITFKRVHDRQ